jgi:hypothetical protein
LLVVRFCNDEEDTMKGAVRYLAFAVCATLATACGGWDDTARNGFGSEGPSVSPRETAGTSGSIDKEITISGCVTRVAPDAYVLTSIDDRIAGHYQGTAGRGQGDPDTRPTDVNRGENERMRHEQNPSAEVGRYRLTGRSDQFVAHVDREVEVKGQVLTTDNRSETPDMLRVGSMRSTGRKCSRE